MHLDATDSNDAVRAITTRTGPVAGRSGHLVRMRTPSAPTGCGQRSAGGSAGIRRKQRLSSAGRERAPYQFQVVTPGSELFERCRSEAARCMSALYRGWDTDFDRQFDEATLAFCLIHPARPEEIAATLKIVYKDRLPEGLALPLELADHAPHSAPHGAIEVSGFALRDRRAARRLCEAAIAWVHVRGLGDIYSCYDVDNPTTRRLFMGHAGLVEAGTPALAFDSVRSRRTGLPVRWRVLVDRAATRGARVASFDRLAEDVQGLPGLGDGPPGRVEAR